MFTQALILSGLMMGAPAEGAVDTWLQAIPHYHDKAHHDKAHHVHLSKRPSIDALTKALLQGQLTGMDTLRVIEHLDASHTPAEEQSQTVALLQQLIETPQRARTRTALKQENAEAFDGWLRRRIRKLSIDVLGTYDDPRATEILTGLASSGDSELATRAQRVMNGRGAK